MSTDWNGADNGRDQYEAPNGDRLLLFPNGMVAYFRGEEQAPEYQGRALEVIARLAVENDSLRKAIAK